MNPFTSISDYLSDDQRLKLQYLSFLDAENIFNEYNPLQTSFFNINSRSSEIPLRNLDKLKIDEKYILGKRIEHFFSHYLTYSEKYNILAENLQIRDGKNTIGELDYIVNDKDKNQIIHIELVYKFYLYDALSTTNEIHKWIGPNRNDSLTGKLEKLSAHQFPLLFSDYTKNYLNELRLSGNFISQQLCFKAQLYVHEKIYGKTLNKINNKAIRGFWLFFHEFSESNYGDFDFFIPEKQDWILSPNICQKWYSFREAKHLIGLYLADKWSPLCWMKTRSETFYRFFVVWW